MKSEKQRKQDGYKPMVSGRDMGLGIAVNSKTGKKYYIQESEDPRWCFFIQIENGEKIDTSSNGFIEDYVINAKEVNIGDKNRGIYKKFEVTRTDGKSAPGEKHENCRYFVIDLDHDQFAGPAIQAYANACKDEYPALSRDLLSIVDENMIGKIKS